MPRPDSPLQQQRWLRCVNIDTVDVPPFGVVCLWSPTDAGRGYFADDFRIDIELAVEQGITADTVIFRDVADTPEIVKSSGFAGGFSSLGVDYPDVQNEAVYNVSSVDIANGGERVDCEHIGFANHLGIKSGEAGLFTLDTPAICLETDDPPFAPQAELWAVPQRGDNTFRLEQINRPIQSNVIGSPVAFRRLSKTNKLRLPMFSPQSFEVVHRVYFQGKIG